MAVFTQFTGINEAVKSLKILKYLFPTDFQE